MAKTISHCQGDGCITHNNRDFIPRNVDPTRIKDNITFAKIPIAEAYERCFGEAVERYNAKQKRADRRIKGGYFQFAFKTEPKNTVITASDKRKSFYEDIVQIGDMNDTGVGTADSELAAECLKEYAESFSERNPNFFVFNSVLHLDEKTPHLHIDYIPIGHNYKRGVDTQNGLAQALKEMGYGEGEDTINRWRLAECKVLTEICERHGIEISGPKKGRGYTFTVEEYKKHQDTIHALEHQTAELSESLKELEEKSRIADAVGIESKKLPFNNAMVSQDDLDKLEAEKKTVTIREIGVIRKERELREREETIAEKETELENVEKLSNDSKEYHALLPQYNALVSRCEKAESRLKEAVRHIVEAVLMNNGLLVKLDNYGDLEETASPRHKALARSISKFFSGFLKSIGFPEEAERIVKKAGISTEIEAEFRRIENPQQRKAVKR